jgi:phosphatidylinositol 3-kinase
MAPIRLCFESLTADNAKLNYMIIFKNGDDLRQDQLVMQVFSLMDTLLKGVN